MFRYKKDASYTQAKIEVEKEYKVQKNDYLSIEVYTNKGERLIDPNFDIQRSEFEKRGEYISPKYLVRQDGTVNLPMIEEAYVEGLTIPQIDSLLAVAYSQFYEEVFVISKILSRRVFVLGPNDGKVITLENENMNLIEVLALYGGISELGKSKNIRLIRGDLSNPQIQIIDLSTIEGMKNASLDLKSLDIIYIESRKKSFSETVREITPLVAIFGNIVTLVVLIARL
jgi:polysaccharide export outer membrane protein